MNIFLLFRCDQSGHFARECPSSGGDRVDDRRGGGGGGVGGGNSSSVCYRCDGVGRFLAAASKLARLRCLDHILGCIRVIPQGTADMSIELRLFRTKAFPHTHTNNVAHLI